MLEEARGLEQEFERVVRASHMPCLAKRLMLSRLIRKMFGDAVADYERGHQHSDIRADFVMDFFDRDDLGPALIEEAFSLDGANAEDDLNYAQLMHIVARQQEKLASYMPEISLRFEN